VVSRRPRNVFITGASGGLGAALARLYADQGATVGLFARRQEELDALAASLPGGRAAVYTGDVRDADALEKAAVDFIARFGAPDVVIANAGISQGALTQRDDLPTFRDIPYSSRHGGLSSRCPTQQSPVTLPYPPSKRSRSSRRRTGQPMAPLARQPRRGAAGRSEPLVLQP